MQCTLACQKSDGAAKICPDYDDANIFCNFYATFECATVSNLCNATLLQQSPCETHCISKSRGIDDPAEQLDTFLQCYIEKCLSR